MPSQDTDLGGQNNILSFTASQSNGNTYVHFTRKLDTGDYYDVVISPGDMNVIWAIGPSPQLQYHGFGADNRGSQTVNFFATDVCKTLSGCSACNANSNCVFCESDGLCYERSNSGPCAVLNTTCSLTCPNALPNAWVPAGYCASSWLSGLSSPRALAVASNGDLLVLESGSSQIRAVWMDANDKVQSAVLARIAGLTHGIAISAPYVYASSMTTVYRWKYTPGMRTDLGQPEIVISYMPINGHIARTLIFDAQGLLYVSTGSGTNVDLNSNRSRIMRFDLSKLPPDGTGIKWVNGELFADGLRNTVGLDFDAKGRLWGVVNGMDNLNRQDMGGDIHQNNPAETVYVFEQPGKFYGYPYCWIEYSLPSPPGKGPGTPWAYPYFMNDGVHTDAWCSNTNNVQRPAWPLAAHQAPLGIHFFYGTDLPNFAPGGAFIALHGSWDRQPTQGYKVLYLQMEGGVPTKEVEVLHHDGDIANWPNNVRPVNVIVNQCGYANKASCLYISSDSSNEIIKLSYNA